MNPSKDKRKKSLVRCPTCKKELTPTEPNGHVYRNVAIGKNFTMFCSVECREKFKGEEEQ